MTLKEYLHSFNITLEAFSRETDISYLDSNKICLWTTYTHCQLYETY